MIYNTTLKGGGSSYSLFGLTAEQLDGTISNGQIVYPANTPAPDLSSLNTYVQNQFSGRFNHRTDITGVPKLGSGKPGYQTFYRTFMYCTNITGCDLSTTMDFSDLNNNVFEYCFAYSGVQSADLRGLVSIGGYYVCSYMFYNCTSLTSVNISNLTTILSGQGGCMNAMFRGCTSLTTVRFNSLATIYPSGCLRYMFADCTSLQTLYFPAMTTPGGSGTFDYMLSGVTGCTVHFPSAMSSTMSSYSSVTNGFSGTSTTVLFDL